MYKILIVDDEEFIRSAIVNIIDWNSIGFDEVYEAEDGELAYEIAIEKRPDVILTDIRMPFMDGLELSEKISNQLPNTKILILSGHDEFEYAKQALQIGVLDYIVKPIRAETLKQIMITTKQQLDDENKRREEFTRIKRQLRNSLPLLKEKFYQLLISDKLNINEIEKRASYLQIDLSKCTFTVCVFEVTDFEKSTDIEDMEINNISISNILTELIGKCGIVFSDLSSHHVVLYFDLEPDDLEQREVLHEITKKVSHKLEPMHSHSITTGIGNTVSSVADIHHSYKDALHALEYKVAFGKGNVFDIIDLGYRNTDSYFPVKKINNLIATVRLGIGYKETMNELFQHLYMQKEISADNLRIILYEIINGMQKLLIETKVCDSLEYNIYNDIMRAQTINEVKPLIESYLNDVHTSIHSGKNNKKRQLIERAKIYINENYNDPELNLSTTANAIFLSPSYFSVLFKKETGKTFIDYMTKTRMEKSKELLRLRDLKAYEIAQKVGYNDPHYFSIAFKKYTGYTPSKYRQLEKDTFKLMA